MENTNTKKSYSKEIKLILGILITVMVLAIIVTLVVIAVISQEQETRLLSGKYDYVSEEMYDGVMIVSQDGDYKLVKDNSVLTGFASYSFIEYDSTTKTYIFIAKNGTTGALDSTGKVLYSRKLEGVEIKADNYTEQSFYIATSGAEQYVYYTDVKYGPYKEVFTNSDLGLDMPLGMFVYTDDDNNQYITSVFNSNIKLNYSNVEVVNGTIVTDNVSKKSYTMPKLEEVEFLSGASSTDILYTDTIVKFVTQATVVSPDLTTYKYFIVFNGTQEEITLEVTSKPTIKAVYSDRVMYTIGATTYIVDSSGAVIVSGYLTEVSSRVYAIGNELFNLSLEKLDITIDYTKEYRRILGSGNEYLLANNNLYAYKNNNLELKLENVTYQMYADEVFFIADGKLYNGAVGTVATSRPVIEFADTNLVRLEDSRYTDLTGVSVVTNVIEYMRVYNFDKSLTTGEYVFLTEHGDYVTYDGTIYFKNSVSIYDEEILTCFKSGSGGYMLETNSKLISNSEVILKNNGQDYDFFGTNGIIVVTNSTITTYMVNAKSELAKVESHYFSNIVSEVSEYGVVIKDTNGLYGFISTDGKLKVKPTYKKLVLDNYFAIATLSNDSIVVLDKNGSRVTNRQYKNVVAIYNDFIVLEDESKIEYLVTVSGQEYTGITYLGGITNYTESETDRIEAIGGDELTGHIMDTSIGYHKFYIDEKIQILQVM